MNPAGDYSAAYVRLETNTSLVGHGISFTIGRGNDLCTAAARQIAECLVGKTLAELTENMGKTWRYLVADSQLRWVGPEKGVIHLGLSSCVNALWDLWARYLQKPVWMVVADMTPEEFVSCIDFRYITDAITPPEALEILRAQEKTKADRLEHARRNQAVPAYSTQAGWLGFSDERMKELIQQNISSGIDKFKFKVGGNVEDDIRRLRVAREVIGYDRMLMVDANQVWDVPEAIEVMKQLVHFKPTCVKLQNFDTVPRFLVADSNCALASSKSRPRQMIFLATPPSGKRCGLMAVGLPLENTVKIESCSSSCSKLARSTIVRLTLADSGA